jgi:hypothetical protein
MATLLFERKASAFAATFFLVVASSQGIAQTIPPHAEGLSEEFISVPIDNGSQVGVLSRRKGTASPSRLIVLLPGYPSVVRPAMANNVMASSQLTGNFLIRARRHLANDQVMTLLVDCHTSIGSICTPSYQASRDRYRHVKSLIEAAKKRAPSIKQIYLVSTSAGSISSAFIAKYGQSEFAGVIHTASIDPTAPRSYAELNNFDYSAIKIPQAFIHHIDDPCRITGYNYIRSVSERYRVPLISVSGGEGFTGDACAAHTQHGFKGRESAVMQRILRMVSGGSWNSSRL